MHRAVKLVLASCQEASVLINYHKYISMGLLNCLHDMRTGFPQKPGDPRQSKAISGNAFYDPCAKVTVKEVPVFAIHIWMLKFALGTFLVQVSRPRFAPDPSFPTKGPAGSVRFENSLFSGKQYGLASIPDDTQ